MAALTFSKIATLTTYYSSERVLAQKPTEISIVTSLLFHYPSKTSMGSNDDPRTSLKTACIAKSLLLSFTKVRT